MKKLLSLTVIAAFALFLASCGRAELAASTPTPTVTASETSFELDPASPASMATPEGGQPSGIPVQSASAEPVSEQWEEIYGDFLETNYDKLYEAFFGGIAGIGYIDLDVDGSPELIIFDAGASASMGVQIFDVVDAAAVLVSANMLTVREAFGGDFTGGVYVNTNSFGDFRLMEDADTGERFFAVVSMNGALDFAYSELIVFERSGAAAAPVSLYYQYVETDEEGTVTLSRYEKGGSPISGGEYEDGLSSFYDSASDLGYEAAGVFIWESDEYQDGFDGFMAMAKAAAERYVPAFGFMG